MAKSGEVLETLVIGLICIAALLLIPRIYQKLLVTNAAVAKQTSPTAATNSAWARMIGSAGDVGVGLIDKWGGELVDIG